MQFSHTQQTFVFDVAAGAGFLYTNILKAARQYMVKNTTNSGRIVSFEAITKFILKVAIER